MRRPGIATIGSILLHGAVVGLALFPWPRSETPTPVISSVPVSIVSSETVAAAPADNPSDELVPEASAETPPTPLEAEPLSEPTPPTPTPPTPTPTPRPTPAPTPAPRPATRPTPPAPTPARPTPPRPSPTPPRKAPSLDLDALAQPSPNRRPIRPATGDSGQGQAARATGAQIANLGGQIVQHWILQCDIPGVNELSIPVRVTISSTGRITAGPTLTEQRSGAVWRTASDAMVRAVRAAEPFDVPDGFEGQQINFRFRADQACANR